MLRFRVLGAVQVLANQDVVDIGGPRQRRLLAALLLHRNRAASLDRLVEVVFAGAPSPQASATLRTYVTRLRRALGPNGAEVLEWRAPGYRLRVEDEAIDVALFESEVERGSHELAYGDAAAAVATLRRALGRWRGGAYEEFSDEAWLQPEVRRLDEVRQAAREHLLDAELACGRAAEVVAELEALVSAEPLREGYRRRLVIALYRSGRQADALAAVRDHRRLLVEELGLDPGPELAELETRVLRRDPALQLAVPAGRPLRGYQLGERLGTGRLGTVFAARQPAVPRDYAIRIYPAEVADQPDFVRSFEADARRLASLDHPAVVAVHDAWREPGAAALVMRRMTGGTLRDRLDDDGRLSPPMAADVFERIGAALLAAAQRGIVHGNLRPGSVLFDEAGSAHLGDFTLGGTTTATGDDATAFLELASRVGPAGTLTTRPLDAAVTGSGQDAVQAAVDHVLHHLRGSRVGQGLANPYVGLRAFDEGDADRFFGREALVEELTARVGDSGPALTLVVGGSGSGKSSLVRAGLVASRPGDWLATVMLPGSAPFKELRSALQRVAVSAALPAAEGLAEDPSRLPEVIDALLPTDARLLLVVDQLEELFTLCGGDRRRAFLDALAAMATARGRVHVVATLRADFFDRPLAHPRFGPLVRAATVPLPAMSATELETAITGPASGLVIEPGLVAELVSSVVDQPAALPGLQFTLYQLVAEDGAALTRAGLAALGGVEGAVATRAEQLYEASSAPDRQVIRHVFERLVVVEQAGAATRRRTTRADLAGGAVQPAALDRVLEAWVAARLLATDRHPETREPTVEIAHEAVLERWPRLRQWVEEGRDWLRTMSRLRATAATWEDLGRDDGALLRGAGLDQAIAAVTARPGAAPENVSTLVDASRVQRDAERRADAEVVAQRERSHRRLRRQRWQLVAALLVALVVGGVAIERQAAASRSADAAEARARAATAGLVAAADAALDSDWPLALLLAVEAHRIDDSALTRRGLLNALVTPRPVPTSLHESDVGYQVVALDDQQQVVVAKQVDGTVDVLDADDGARTVASFLAPARERVNGLAVSHDLVAASGLPLDGIGVVVHDLASGARVAELPEDADAPVEVAFDPDGTRLAVAGLGRVRLYDVASWDARTLDTGSDELVLTVAFDEAGARLFAGGSDGTVWRWELPSDGDGAPGPAAAVLPMTPGPSPVVSIVPLPESRLAVATFDAGVYVVAADDLRIEEGPLTHGNAVTGMAGSEDGTRLAVAAFNRAVVWSLAGSPRPERDVTLVADATDVAFTRDGDLVTVGLAGRVARWDLDPPSPVMEPVPGTAPGIPNLAPDGELLAMMGGGQGVRLFDVDRREQVGRLDIDDPANTSMVGLAFVPSTTRVAVASCPDTAPTAGEPCPGQVAVYDTTTGELVAGPEPADLLAPWVPWTVAAGPDGQVLALGLVGGVVELRSTATLEVLARLDELVTDGGNFVTHVGFSSADAGLLVATTGDDIAVWDVSGDRPAVVATGGPTGVTARFAPNDLLVTSAQDGSIALRDPSSLEVLDQATGLELPVTGPTFTDDAGLMATTDDFTGAVRIWDLVDLAQAAGPIGRGGGAIDAAGTVLVVGGDPVHRLTLDPARWREAACETAGRNLTRQEWERYFSEEPYRLTCPGQPSPG